MRMQKQNKIKMQNYFVPFVKQEKNQLCIFNLIYVHRQR